MSIDLEKLSPAPWDEGAVGNQHKDGRISCRGVGPDIPGDPAKDKEVLARLQADAAFIALARNAFDVMARRGWHPSKDIGGWYLNTSWDRAYDLIPEFRKWLDSKPQWPDPFTALVEADKWYRENIEARKEGSPLVVEG